MARLINRWFVVALLMGLAATPVAARDKSRRVAPSMNPGAWFVDGDYPADAKRAKQQGRVVVKASVNAQGRVSSCDVTTSSDSASLDALTCRLVIARGRFLPELDRAGNAVPSSYPISTRWVLRNPEPAALGNPWRAAAVMYIDQAGKIVSCKDETYGSLPTEFEKPLCSLASTTPPAFGIFLRGGTGAPEPVEVTTETSMSFDIQPAPPMVYEGKGRVILRLIVFRFDVDTTGKVTNCRVLAQSSPDEGNPCDDQAQTFLPISEPRAVTLKVAMTRGAGG